MTLEAAKALTRFLSNWQLRGASCTISCPMSFRSCLCTKATLLWLVVSLWGARHRNSPLLGPEQSRLQCRRKGIQKKDAHTIIIIGLATGYTFLPHFCSHKALILYLKWFSFGKKKRKKWAEGLGLFTCNFSNKKSSLELMRGGEARECLSSLSIGGGGGESNPSAAQSSFQF